MTKNILFLCVLFVAFSATSGAYSASNNNVSASDLAKVEAEAKKVSLKHKEFEIKANKIKKEMASVNQKMIAAAKKIQNGEDELQAKNDELEKLQNKLSLSEKKFNSENGMLVETLAALQTLALRPSEAILVQPLSPVEVMRSSILLRGSIHSLEKRANIIRESIEDISEQKTIIAARLKGLEEQNKNLENQRQNMEKLSAQKKQMYEKLSTQSEEAKKQATALASQANNLRDLLDKLESQKQIKRQQLAEKERLAKEREVERLRAENNHELIGTGFESEDLINTKVETATDFAKAKGRLSRPARGPIITNYHQEMSKGVVSNGIDIKTTSKAQIIAPYDGTVIFAGPFKNFDNLIIIDHGDGFTSLLSGLGETYSQVGQMLLAGEPVGIMPKNNTAKLHMEIRKNNHPVDPSDWISK